jgi:hypothetical protein
MREEYSSLKVREQTVSNKYEKLKRFEKEVLEREDALNKREELA